MLVAAPQVRRFLEPRRFSTFLSAWAESELDRDSSWFQLYIRAWRLGLGAYGGVRIEPDVEHSTAIDSAAILFPEFDIMVAFPRGDWPRHDAAVLFEGPPARDAVEHERGYKQVIFALLQRNEWGVQQPATAVSPVNSSVSKDLILVGESLMLRAEIKAARPRRFAPAPIAPSFTQEVAGTIWITEDVDPEAVVEALSHHGALMVALEDLRWLRRGSRTLWPLVGHQARRFARASGGRSRVVYFAALIRTAVELGRVDREVQTEVADWLRVLEIGVANRIDVAVVDYEDELVLFRVVFLETVLEQSPPPISFVVGIDPDRPFIHPHEDVPEGRRLRPSDVVYVRRSRLVERR